MVQLINHSFWKNFYEELKKLSKQLITFSFFHKKFTIIIRTSFGLDPKQDWILAQQAQTINL